MFALFFNYCFQISAIPCLIAIDLTRQATGRWDLLPFIQSKSKTNLRVKKQDCLTAFFRNFWKPMILSKFCKFITLTIVLVFSVLFFFALYKMELGLDQQLPVLEKGNMFEFFGDVKKYIEMGPIGSLIIKNADYSIPQTRSVIDGLVDLISQRKGLTAGPFRIWYQGVISLKDNVRVPGEVRNNCFQGIPDPVNFVKDFEQLTDHYLNIDMNHPCCRKVGICGGQFYEDIERNFVS